MISSISGNVISLNGNEAVVELSGAGISLNVKVSATALTSLTVNQNCQLLTEFIVREDSWQLFGFADEQERIWFRHLHAISGIGPKTAMATLSVLGVQGITNAVINADETALTAVPGLGKKSAGRIVLELKDKIKQVATVSSNTSDVIAALINLGWSEKIASSTVAELDSSLETSSLLREALARLAKQ